MEKITVKAFSTSANLGPGYDILALAHNAFRDDLVMENLTLVKGDMFFSGLQTLTVSVNTKGVMGRGLASRAKYQFPDVYIYYQDSCNNFYASIR